MTPISQRMDITQFERVAAAKCNWSARSLDVARALIVEGVSLSVAATTHAMSAQQANVIRTRFLAKAENLRIEEFMRRENPKLASTALEPYSAQIRVLRDKGYTIEQIVSFLKECGVSTSQTTVRNFLRSIQI